jgi:RNA polymerase sigma-70 factor (ECF subfamily)
MPHVVAAEQELARRAQAGDTSAFGDLITCFHAPLHGLLARLGIPEPQREEVIQDIFIAAYDDLPRYDPQRPFATWLWGIATMRARRHWQQRTRARRFQPLDALHSHLATAAATADQPGEELRREHLAACLERLAPTAAQLVHLHYHEGLDGATIAARTGRALGTIRMALSRIRSELRRCMQQQMHQVQP